MVVIDFKEFYNNVLVDVCDRVFKEISIYTVKQYNVYLSDMYDSTGVRDSIKRRFDADIDKVNKLGFFNDNISYLNCIRISSICNALIKNKVVCFLSEGRIPSDLITINYRIVVEFVKQAILYMLSKDSDKKIKSLNYIVKDFDDILLLSTIINDTSKGYQFDLLNYATIIYLIYEYNKNSLSTT